MSQFCPLPEFTTVVRWTVQDVVNWLSKNKFNDCVKKFRDASVDGNKLVHIMPGDLRQINVSKKDASKILSLINEVQKPNEKRPKKRGQLNVPQHNERLESQDSDSDGPGWDSDFDDQYDDTEEDYMAPETTKMAEATVYLDLEAVGLPIDQAHQPSIGDEATAPTPVRAPANPSRGIGLPTPPTKNQAPAEARKRRDVPPPPQEEPEEQYEDPYASRYPGSKQSPPVPSQPSLPQRREPPPPVQEEVYEDPDNAPAHNQPKVPDRRQRMPAPMPDTTPQLPPPREPPRGRSPAPQPVNQEEVYEVVEEESVMQPQGRRLPPVPPTPTEPRVYELEHEDTNKGPQTPPAKPPRVAAPEPEDYEEVDEKVSPVVPTQPPKQRPRAPAPAPTPTTEFQQEDYEEVDKKLPSRGAPPIPQPLPPRTKPAPPPPSDGFQQEDYEEVDEKLPRRGAPPIPQPLPPRTKPAPPPPSDGQEVYEDVSDEPQETVPPRRDHAPRKPLPSEPEEDESYLDMEETMENAPPPPSRPPIRLPNMRPKSPEVDSEPEDYIEPDTSTVPPPPKPSKVPTQVRVLPPPPGKGSSYTKVEVKDKPVNVTNNSVPVNQNEAYLANVKFYHGEITRDEGDKKLHQQRVDGMYLIRKSTKNANQPFTLQLYYQGNTYNLPVFLDNSQYYISNEISTKFGNILEMVNHFKTHKLILKGGGETMLKKSVPKS